MGPVLTLYELTATGGDDALAVRVLARDGVCIDGKKIECGAEVYLRAAEPRQAAAWLAALYLWHANAAPPPGVPDTDTWLYAVASALHEDEAVFMRPLTRAARVSGRGNQAFFVNANLHGFVDPGLDLVYARRFVTCAQAAQITGEAASTWRNRCAAGEVPAIKKGKTWLIPRSAVSAP